MVKLLEKIRQNLKQFLPDKYFLGLVDCCMSPSNAPYLAIFDAYLMVKLGKGLDLLLYLHFIK